MNGQVRWDAADADEEAGWWRPILWYVQARCSLIPVDFAPQVPNRCVRRLHAGALRPGEHCRLLQPAAPQPLAPRRATARRRSSCGRGRWTRISPWTATSIAWPPEASDAFARPSRAAAGDGSGGGAHPLESAAPPPHAASGSGTGTRRRGARPMGCCVGGGEGALRAARTAAAARRVRSAALAGAPPAARRGRVRPDGPVRTRKPCHGLRPEETMPWLGRCRGLGPGGGRAGGRIPRPAVPAFQLRRTREAPSKDDALPAHRRASAPHAPVRRRAGGPGHRDGPLAVLRRAGRLWWRAGDSELAAVLAGPIQNDKLT